MKLISNVFDKKYYQIVNRLLYKLLPACEVCNHKPLRLSLQIVNRCTIRCKFCIRNADDIAEYNSVNKGQPDMSFVIFKNILNRYKAATSVCLAGFGEPFLNQDIFRFIQYSNEKKIKTSIISNGTILDKVLDKIYDLPPSEISVSINALTKGEFADITGVDSSIYLRILNNVSMLSGNKPAGLTVRVSYVLNNNNLSSAPEMIELAKELGVDGVDFHNLIPYEDCGNSFSDAVIDSKDNLNLLSKLKKNDWGINVNFPVPISRELKVNNCTRHFKLLNVSSVGDIGGCARAVGPSKDFGNVLDQIDPWNGRKMKETRRKLLRGELPFSICRTCVNVSPFYIPAK